MFRTNSQSCRPVIHVSARASTGVEDDVGFWQRLTIRSSAAILAFYNTPPATPTPSSIISLDPSADHCEVGVASGMEGGDQRRRQGQHADYPQSYADNPQFIGATTSNIRSIRSSPLGPPSDRIGHAQYLPTHPSTSAPAALSPTVAQDIGGYGYPHGPQYHPQQTPGAAFAYQTGYSRHPQRSQQSPQYPQQAMYALPQQTQLQHQSHYNAPPPYQQRQPATVEALANQFSGQQYYNTPEVSTPSASTPYPTPTFQQTALYGRAEDLGRSTLASGYPLVGSNFGQASTAEPTVQQQDQQQGQSLDTADAAYQQLLRQTNTLVTQSRLVEARQSLLEMSIWLLSNIESLGLHRDTPDDRTKYRERLKFWQNFHLCWLALLQRQFEITQMQATEGVIPNGASLLTKDLLEHLGDEAVRLSDGLHKYGLVDYDMGFGEEEVITMAEKCIDALSDGTDDAEMVQTETGPPATE
ncbi:MAG: hypothetical protein Q9164_000439 [Protoblastenia rupestris]